nr:serine hydrolase domain-containing protein [Hymenobacter translucens]
MATCDTILQDFIRRWKIPGASVAISRHGQLVYARGFGYADLSRRVPMQPHNLLRVASVSKPVTAIAIMKLAEDSVLDLDHPVFGPGGYLDDPYYTSVITDERIYSITSRQLLEHSAGWNRSSSYGEFASSDPIDFPLHVAETLHAPNPVGDSTLVRFLLQKGLDFAPGARYAYSNVGYLVLGKVLERLTGQRYEDWVRNHILVPSGVQEARLGRNLLTDRQEREAAYFSRSQRESSYGTGKTVPGAYGGWNFEAMNAHGGWVFSARDLVRLLLAVDGDSAQPDVLSAASAASMREPSDNNRRYGKGWMLNRQGVWWHTGSLDGTASCVFHTPDGFTWAILLNARATSNRFWNELENLGWTCLRDQESWPTLNLFPPTQSAAGLRAAPAAAGAVRLTWANGNGSHRLVLLREGSPIDAFPLEGIQYPANPTLDPRLSLGRGTSVVAQGTDSTALLAHLTPGKTYYARVVEYYQNEATGQQPVYALDTNPIIQFRTPAPVASKPPVKAAGSRRASKRPASKAPARPAAPDRYSYLSKLRAMSRGWF